MLSVRLLLRVLSPFASWPHGEHGCRQPELRVVAVLGHERRSRAGRTNELRAASLLELDVVNCGAERDVAEAKRVARLDVGPLVADDRVAGVEPVRREDERLFAVGVVE